MQTFLLNSKAASLFHQNIPSSPLLNSATHKGIHQVPCPIRLAWIPGIYSLRGVTKEKPKRSNNFQLQLGLESAIEVPAPYQALNPVLHLSKCHDNQKKKKKKSKFPVAQHKVIYMYIVIYILNALGQSSGLKWLKQQTSSKRTGLIRWHTDWERGRVD